MNGRLLPRPAAVWSGTGVKRVDATLDKQEDKIDVYRIVIPAGRSARISVIPRFGDPALDVFSASAFSVNDFDGRVARSRAVGQQAHREGHDRQPRQRGALVLRVGHAAGLLALPGARVHPAGQLARSYVPVKRPWASAPSTASLTASGSAPAWRPLAFASAYIVNT